jgi:hypothetical protein
MQIQRTMKVLTISATFAALGTLVACNPRPRTGVEVSASWDSGPLDRDYAREHASLEARHTKEIANPEHGESKFDMDKRQSNENYVLETRYKQGKDTHADALPPS